MRPWVWGVQKADAVTVVNETNPGPEVKDDAQIRDWIKRCLSTTWRECFGPLCVMLVVDPDSAG